jgi:hypothetical protein
MVTLPYDADALQLAPPATQTVVAMLGFAAAKSIAG